MTAPIRSMPELIAGLRDCVHERGVAYHTVDAIAGLADRHTSKLFGPLPTKNLGQVSLGNILGAVGKALVLVDDPEQMKRVEGRWTPRKRPLKASRCASALSMPAEMPAPPKFGSREYMKMIGIRGASKAGKASAKRRAKTMGKRARQRAAQHAARARWAKRATAAEKRV